MTAKQRVSSQKKPRGKGVPFKPNDPATGEIDPRINRKGRQPANHEELNKLLDEIFAEEIADKYGNKMQKLRAALNQLLLGKNPSGAMYVLDRRFGKVKELVENSGTVKVIVEYANDDGNSAKNP